GELLRAGCAECAGSAVGPLLPVAGDGAGGEVVEALLVPDRGGRGVARFEVLTAEVNSLPSWAVRHPGVPRRRVTGAVGLHPGGRAGEQRSDRTSCDFCRNQMPL